jgi:apolipoprotein N-acyltransferase
LAAFTDLALPLFAATAVSLYGARRLVQSAPPAPEIKVALIQPSIPQRLIFDPKETNYRFNTLMELSRLALAAKPDLLVWPEASLPSLDEAKYAAITNLVCRHRLWMILGSDEAELRDFSGGKEQTNYYNSALLLDPQGRWVNRYRKHHLVIFGEYVPLMDWLPFLKFLTPIEASFTPGRGPDWFEVAPPPARCSVLICFEDVLPHLVRRYVDDRTDFVLNLTNNGWFGESAAQWQHAATAVFRAVENGLPMVRCTNNGLTCWVDAYGRLHEAGFEDERDIYAAGFKTVRVPLAAAGHQLPRTFYREHGDVFGWGCCGWAAAALVLRRRRSSARP